MNIDLRKILLYASGKNFRVTGGFGLSQDDAVMILENHHGLAIDTQNYVLDNLIELFRLDNASKGASNLIQIGNSYFDNVVVRHSYEDSQGEESVKDTPLFFNITSSHANIGKTLEQVKNKDELELIQNNQYWATKDYVFTSSYFIDAAAVAITYGAADFTKEDLVHLYEISDESAEELYTALKDCGLLLPEVHSYYQKYFGDIHPEGYWEIYW